MIPSIETSSVGVDRPVEVRNPESSAQDAPPLITSTLHFIARYFDEHRTIEPNGARTYHVDAILQSVISEMMAGLVSPTQYFADSDAFLAWYSTILPISFLKPADQTRLADAYTLSIELARAEGRYFGRSEQEWAQRAGGDRSLALDQFIAFFGSHGYTLVSYDGLTDKGQIIPEKRDRAYELLCRNVLPDKFLITAREFCSQMEECVGRIGELQKLLDSATTESEKAGLFAKMTSEMSRIGDAYEPKKLDGYFI